MNIGDGLRRFRQKHGYTQESLAEYLGCNRVTVARWEGNQVDPHSAYVLRICAIEPEFPSLCNISVTNRDIWE